MAAEPAETFIIRLPDARYRAEGPCAAPHHPSFERLVRQKGPICIVVHSKASVTCRKRSSRFAKAGITQGVIEMLTKRGFLQSAAVSRCPLIGVDRKWSADGQTGAYDPTRTFGAVSRNELIRGDELVCRQLAPALTRGHSLSNKGENASSAGIRRTMS
jgi:hypothetical protein